LTKKDVIIVGAGASGLMCATVAGKRGRSVLLVDHAGRAGNKIRVSGGGRCNFTNITCSHDNYSSQNAHFCKSALARFTPHDIIAMLKKHGIPYHEEENGRLFCNRSSMDIIHMLRRECDEAGVEIRLRCGILGISKNGLFTMRADGNTVHAESLVIATGGLSFPKLGATDYGYRIARQFGLKVTPLQPALVPFTLHPEDLAVFRELSGISIKASVSCNGRCFLENILFTHRGLSGPAVLQSSLYWKKGDPIIIDLFPDADVFALFMEKKQNKITMRNLLSRFFPSRFVGKWCDSYIRSKPLNQCTIKELANIAHLLHHWEITPARTGGFEKAEVTRGGIDTAELSSATMETGKVPGLYFVGEVIDVTGQLGGYNLHWAWASGFTAGQYA
jgi:predicted Rossmann fold flavoprotein